MTLPPRSMLFVSGEQSARFDKAMAAGADLVCLDLEDAVHPDRKSAARAGVLGWLTPRADRPAGGPAVAVRVNGLRTLDGLRDLLALAESTLHIDWLVLPKAEHASDIQGVEAWCGARVGAIAALVETPFGIENAAALAGAGGRLGALMLGGVDLCASLGARLDWDGLLSARGRLVNAARVGGLQAWDVPWLDLGSDDGLATDTRRAVGLGFDCKAAIHPKQITTIHAAFQPTAAELEWAEALLAAVADNDSRGAFLFRGAMVDAPVVRRARRIAASARLAPSPESGAGTGASP